MNLLLTWMLKNKVASLLGVLLIAVSVFCTFQYFEIQVLKARLTVAEENLKARTAALKALEAEAEILRGRVEAGKQRIAHTKKTYEKKLEELRNQPVPAECPEAVEWGTVEFNKLTEGF